MTPNSTMPTPKDVTKKVVLSMVISHDEAMATFEQKKTSQFKSLLSRTSRDDIHIRSMNLMYECVIIISGKYHADYYRKAIHTISVTSNVKEIVIGDLVFSVRRSSAMKKALAGKRGKDKADITLEEHVFVDKHDNMTFDTTGTIIEKPQPYKISADTIELYPDVVLRQNAERIQQPNFDYDTAIKALGSSLQEGAVEDDHHSVRDLNTEFSLDEITEVYIPVYESLLDGPHGKAAVMRLDAARNKLL